MNTRRSARPRRRREPMLVVLAAAFLSSTARAADSPTCQMTQSLPARCPRWSVVETLPSDRSIDSARMVRSPDGTRLYVAARGTRWMEWSAAGHGVVGARDASTGAALWTVEMPFEWSADGLSAAPGGDVLFVTATAERPTGVERMLLALDTATGARRWETTPRESRWDRWIVHAPVVASDGRAVFVARPVDDEEDGADVVVEAHDAQTGTSLWTRVIETGASDFGPVLAVDPAGARLYVASIWDAWLHVSALAPADGRHIWTSSWANYGERFQPAAIVVSPDGKRLALTGGDEYFDEDPFAVTIMFHSSTGVRAWIDHDYVFGRALAFSCDGSTLFMGSLTGSGYWTFSYESATGRKNWESFAPNLPTFQDAVSVGAIATSRDCARVYVTGTLGGYADTRAYDAATGVELWSGRGIDAGTGGLTTIPSGYDLTVGPDGTVNVVGSSEGIATMAYDG